MHGRFKISAKSLSIHLSPLATPTVPDNQTAAGIQVSTYCSRRGLPSSTPDEDFERGGSQGVPSELISVAILFTYICVNLALWLICFVYSTVIWYN